MEKKRKPYIKPAIAKVAKKLDKYLEMDLFRDKLDKANEILRHCYEISCTIVAQLFYHWSKRLASSYYIEASRFRTNKYQQNHNSNPLTLNSLN